MNRSLLPAALACLLLGVFAGAACAMPVPFVTAVAPAGADPQLVQAASLINSQDFGEAQALLKQAYTKDPKNALTLYLNAVMMFDSGHYGEANTDATAAIALDGTVAQYYFVQAMSVRYNPEFWRVEDMQRTAVGFKRVIKMQPDFAPAYREDAGVTVYFYKLAKGQYGFYDGPDETSDLDTFLTLDPKDGEAHYLRAIGLIWAEDWQKAAVEVATAIALGATHSEVFETQGYLYWKLGKSDQAIAAYKQAYAVDPNAALAQDYSIALEKTPDMDILFEPQVQSDWATSMTALSDGYNSEIDSANAIVASLNSPGDDMDAYCTKQTNLYSAYTVAAAEADGLLKIAHSDADKATFAGLVKRMGDSMAEARTMDASQNCPVPQ